MAHLTSCSAARTQRRYRPELQRHHVSIDYPRKTLLNDTVGRPMAYSGVLTSTGLAAGSAPLWLPGSTRDFRSPTASLAEQLSLLPKTPESQSIGIGMWGFCSQEGEGRDRVSPNTQHRKTNIEEINTILGA